LYGEKRGCKNKLDLKTFEKSQLSFETGNFTAVDRFYIYNKLSFRKKGSSVNWLEPKIQPPYVNLACTNP